MSARNTCWKSTQILAEAKQVLPALVLQNGNEPTMQVIIKQRKTNEANSMKNGGTKIYVENLAQCGKKTTRPLTNNTKTSTNRQSYIVGTTKIFL